MCTRARRTVQEKKKIIIIINNNNNNNNKYLFSVNLQYIPEPGALYKEKQKKKRKRKKLGQYNRNNKLIHGQYTNRYNLHLSLSLSLSHTHTHTHTHTTQQVKWCNSQKKVEGVQV